MDHLGRRERVARPLAAHQVSGDLPQLVVDQTEERILVPMIPGPGTSRDGCVFLLWIGTHDSSRIDR